MSINNLWERFESLSNTTQMAWDELAIISTAISLKRIADVMCANSDVDKRDTVARAENAETRKATDRRDKMMTPQAHWATPSELARNIVAYAVVMRDDPDQLNKLYNYVDELTTKAEAFHRGVRNRVLDTPL